MAKAKSFAAGEYVLTVDKFTRQEGNTFVDYVKGEKLQLDDEEATRLGNASAVAQEASVFAKIAQGDLRGDVLNPADSPEDIEAKIAALKARQDELNKTEEDRVELRSNILDPNVASMKVGDLGQRKAAILEAGEESLNPAGPVVTAKEAKKAAPNAAKPKSS